MKNIIIAPYPNYKITDECIERDIKPNSIDGQSNELKLDKPNVMIAEFADGTRRVMRPGPSILTDTEKYCSVFPNPVHLFFDFAITCYNESEKIKKTSFPSCAQKVGKKIGDLNFLDVDADETHTCYNEFFKLRMNSIIMLSTSVEAFINHSIPNNYSNRTDIERNGKFKDKLTEHLPTSLNLLNFWNDKETLRGAILDLYYMRNDLIHLKTNSEEDFKAYYDVINKMLQYNISSAIKSVAELMNSINPEFIKET